MSASVPPRRRVLYGRLTAGLFGVFGFLGAYLFPDIVQLGLFLSFLAMIMVPAAIVGLYGTKTTAKASFWSILVPVILLCVLYPVMGKDTFLVTTPLSMAIVLGYDWVFRHPLNL